jgi:dihydrofolate reductase
MRRITLQMYITLDGFNEFPEYPGSGDPPNDQEDPVSKEMWVRNWESIDTILFGRNFYEQWAEFWPASKRSSDEHPFYHRMSSFVDTAQKIVFSNRLKELPWQNSRVVSGEPSDVIAKLRTEPGKNMALVGGMCLAQQFMQRGLIDDYFLAVFPVILGKGQNKLFGELENQQTLKLVDSKHFEHGEVFLHYETIR